MHYSTTRTPASPPIFHTRQALGGAAGLGVVHTRYRRRSRRPCTFLPAHLLEKRHHRSAAALTGQVEGGLAIMQQQRQRIVPRISMACCVIQEI